MVQVKKEGERERERERARVFGDGVREEKCKASAKTWSAIAGAKR